MCRASKHPWYKHKGYLHFDFALTQSEAESYAMDPKKVERHRFSPLIHYFKMSRKVSRNKGAEQAYKNGLAGKPKLIVKEKPRNIFYNSHVDGYIYSYYAYKIGEDYENFLKQNELTDNVIAYRAISKNEISLCNIHFAQEAFAKIEAMDEANIVCFDISKFFDKLTEFCGNSIELNKDKTERRVYRLADGGAKIITFEDGAAPAKVQYLGFHFDGESVFIRNSSISKDRGKTVQLIRKNKKKGRVINTADVYKRKSVRIVTPCDDLIKKGFAYYAVRSDRIHSVLSGISEQIQKTDRFIKRAVNRERQREPRR